MLLCVQYSHVMVPRRVENLPGAVWRVTYKKLGGTQLCGDSLWSHVLLPFSQYDMTRRVGCYRRVTQHHRRTPLVLRMTGTKGNMDVILLIFIQSLSLCVRPRRTGERHEHMRTYVQICRILAV
jgi:hypothetical protein